MLTITFPGYPKARAIIIDEPVNGVYGIVDCDVCDGHKVLTESETEGMAGAIEGFIKEHSCVPLAREEEVIAFAERLKKSMGRGKVRVIKGRRCIKEL